ncbi:VOC family protein [Candidatus Roseilinea sp. NK_OTU-006]|nr:VOC family protein [Candidatus Roseilinea sp. NK_OTU-006]
MIEVSFTLPDGRSFGGSMPRERVVHQALHAFLPEDVMHRHRLRITLPTGELIFPDMWLYEIHDYYGHCRFLLEATPLKEHKAEFVNFGFDHLALATTDREACRHFFQDGLKMKNVRDDEHLLVLTTGVNALFFFKAEPGQPLSDGLPSRIHHIGFVVDDLEAAYTHLKATCPEYVSDFTLLERAERLSLYGTIELGGIRFMIQLSQIKPEYKGLKGESAAPLREFYDYASRDYGIRLA